MKLSENYMLKEIAGNYVIIPIGQNVVNFKNMMQLNETGAFILKQLQEEISYEKLLDIMAKEYEAINDELNILKADLDEFLEQSRTLGIVTE